MTDRIREQLSAAYGRMILQMSFVWVATMLAAGVVNKTSGDFVYLLFVLIGGFTLSSAVLESGRRRILDRALS
ncbi:MAG: hypothetical protein M3Y49_06585 [Actinomycetota bacterium]|nr:hypothetical protein [Actinomycetota bacterium]